MSSRIESLAERVAVEWCKVRWESDSDLANALNALLREFESPAALREIEKTAERGEGAKSAQSAEEKPVEPVPDTDTVGTRLVIVGRDDSAGRAYVRHDKSTGADLAEDATVEALGEQDPECTGLTAVWCPVCGDCTCDRMPSGERDLCTSSCKLHGTPQVSRHAMNKQPGTTPQPRDESMDVWVWRDTMLYAMPWEERSLPGAMWCECVLQGERYVPYSQLEAERAKL